MGDLQESGSRSRWDGLETHRSDGNVGLFIPGVSRGPRKAPNRATCLGPGVFNKETVKKPQITEQLSLAKGFGNHTWHRNTAQLSSSEPELGGGKGIALYTPYGVERKKIPQTNKVLIFYYNCLLSPQEQYLSAQISCWGCVCIQIKIRNHQCPPDPCSAWFMEKCA